MLDLICSMRIRQARELFLYRILLSHTLINIEVSIFSSMGKNIGRAAQMGKPRSRALRIPLQ